MKQKQRVRYLEAIRNIGTFSPKMSAETARAPVSRSQAKPKAA